jgi:hypothetical protein
MTIKLYSKQLAESKKKLHLRIHGQPERQIFLKLGDRQLRLNVTRKTLKRS